MVSNNEILTGIISALSSLKEGESISSYELAKELDFHSDTIKNWVSTFKIISELNLRFAETKGKQIIITKSENTQEKFDKILKLLKKKKE